MARPAVLLAALVVLLAVAGLVVVDQRRLAREQDAVARCAEVAAGADRTADRRLAATATYAAAAPVGGGDGPSISERLVARSAGEAAPALSRAATGCRVVAVRPWHPGTASARDNVVTYLEARVAELAEVAALRRRYDDPDPAVERLRERAFPPQG